MKVLVIIICAILLISGLGLFMSVLVIGGMTWAVLGLVRMARPRRRRSVSRR